MISLRLAGDFCSSKFDEETDYLSQPLSILVLLLPNFIREKAHCRPYVQNSKDTNIGDVVKKCREKCPAYEKKLFT